VQQEEDLQHCNALLQHDDALAPPLRRPDRATGSKFASWYTGGKVADDALGERFGNLLRLALFSDAPLRVRDPVLDVFSRLFLLLLLLMLTRLTGARGMDFGKSIFAQVRALLQITVNHGQHCPTGASAPPCLP
jgi:hypothetical protein